MLSGEELEGLYLTLNGKQQTLEVISQKFSKSAQGSPEKAFRLNCSLGQLLMMNLLTKMQRLIGLFLMLEVCIAEGVRHSPLAIMLLTIFDRSHEAYEKQMIHDMLVLGKRDKFAKTRLELLLKEYELCMQDKQPTSPQFELLRKDIMEALPKIPITRASEVSRVLMDYPLTPPEQPLKAENFLASEFTFEGYSASFLRPVPSYIPLGTDELTWINPQILVDIVWDNSYILKEQLQKAQYIGLNKNQSSELLELMNKSAFSIGQKGIQIQDFLGLFTKNPQIALTVLDRVPPQQLNQYYERLVNIELSRSSLENMRKLILQRQVPFMTVNYYVIKAMQKCQSVPDEVNQDRLARLIISFVKELIKSKKLDPKQLQAEIKSFGIRFSQVDEVAKLYKRFAETNK